MRFGKSLVVALSAAVVVGLVTYRMWPVSVDVVGHFEAKFPAALKTDGLIVWRDDSEEHPPVWILVDATNPAAALCSSCQMKLRMESY